MCKYNQSNSTKLLGFQKILSVHMSALPTHLLGLNFFAACPPKNTHVGVFYYTLEYQ